MVNIVYENQAIAIFVQRAISEKIYDLLFKFYIKQVLGHAVA